MTTGFQLVPNVAQQVPAAIIGLTQLLVNAEINSQ